jgi:hypothetical protein
MLNSFLIKFLDILSSIPNKIILLLIKWLYPLERIKKSIHIRPATNQSPISFSLSVSNSTPKVRVALEIINASLLDIIFERLIIQNLILEDEWIISSFIYSERKRIKQGEKEVIGFFIDLNELQVNKINEIKKEKYGKYGRCTIDIQIYFATKFYGNFEKTERLAYVFYE